MRRILFTNKHPRRKRAAEDVLGFLGAVAPFKALPSDHLRRLASAVESKTFARGEVIYREGDKADGVWVLRSGRIQVFKHTAGTKAFAVETLGPGEILGALCRLDGMRGAYPCTASAAAPSVVLRIPDSDFFFCKKSEGFVRSLCGLCSERLGYAFDLCRMTQESVPLRLASTLLRLYHVHGAVVPLTKREMSEMVGATLETTFRVLGKFARRGVIASGRGKILVRKPKELKALARQ